MMNQRPPPPAPPVASGFVAPEISTKIATGTIYIHCKQKIIVNYFKNYYFLNSAYVFSEKSSIIFNITSFTSFSFSFNFLNETCSVRTNKK